MEIETTSQALYQNQGVIILMKVIDNRGETHEWTLIAVALLSLITFKKIKKVERYKNKLKGTFIPY
ncbi:hypothetical protein [Oceanobacillus oncorhynchi]